MGNYGNSDKLKKIFYHFGKDNQIEKLKEEFNELIEAINIGKV